MTLQCQELLHQKEREHLQATAKLQDQLDYLVTIQRQQIKAEQNRKEEQERAEKQRKEEQERAEK